MGPSHSTVKNHTHKRICVITFTYTDILYFTYNTLYVIEPGSTVLVESQPDATGLKVALVYDASLQTKELKYQRFVCKMDSVLNISEIDHDEISWFGENITGYTSGKIKESNMTALTMAYEAVQNLPPTVGKLNGKFEKELIKRVATEYMESRSNNPDGKIPQSASSESLNNKDHNGSSSDSSSPPSSSRQDRTVPMKDNRSAAEKWERELERMKQAASEQEAKLAESKALLNDRLVRVAQEEAFAAEMEAKRLEELRLEEKRRKQLQKELAEEENEKIQKKLKKNKKSNCTLS